VCAPATRACGHAALKSILESSSSLGAGVPVGARRFIDRTPRKAALRPLPKPFRLLSFRGAGGHPWIGNSLPSSESEDSSFRPEELARFRELVIQDTITCWTPAEVDHPIHFFEQFVQCHHCGAQRFRTTTETKCCRNGALILNDVQRLPEELLDLMTGTSALWSHGVSKESRVLNNAFRFGQQVLPRIGGEVQSHVSDAYQHLRITGIPYTVVPNLNASSALRSYIDDPEARSALVSSFSGIVRPTSALVSEIKKIIERFPRSWTRSSTLPPRAKRVISCCATRGRRTRCALSPAPPRPRSPTGGTCASPRSRAARTPTSTALIRCTRL